MKKVEFSLGDVVWCATDPNDTMEYDYSGVPAEPGHYLWLDRRKFNAKRRDVEGLLYVGQSKDLRSRLHRYSSASYKREDPVIRSLFDRIVAPGLEPSALLDAVLNRYSSGLAQMWIREHVVFGWRLWRGPKRIAEEHELRRKLKPAFNPIDSTWTRYDSPDPSHMRSTIRAITPPR